MNTIFIVGVALSLIIYIFVGNYAGRKVKNVEDYYVAGRQAPTVLIVGTLVASIISTAAFMGDAGMCYDGYVVVMLFLAAINCVGYVLGAVFFGRHLRRSRALTVPEFFGKRFDSKGIQRLLGLITIIGIACYLVSVTQGAALLLQELLGTSYLVSLIIVWVAYTSFTFYSGSKGVLLTDTMMFFIFFLIALIGLPFIINDAGGLTVVVERLATLPEKMGILSMSGLTGPNAYWPTAGETFAWAVSFGIVWMIVFMISPWQAGRYMMAKSEHVVLRSGVITGVIVLTFYTVLYISGGAMNLINPGITPSENVLVWAAFNIFPTAIGVLTIAGIVAAALSSASTFLSLIGFSATRDIVKQSEESKNSLAISRVVMLVAGFIVLVVTYFQPPAVLFIAYFAATLFACTIGFVGICSVWSKWITKAGAMAGIIAGLAGAIIPQLLVSLNIIALPSYFGPPVIGIILNIIATIVVSKLTVVTENERLYREKLHVKPDDYKDSSENKRTMLYPKLAIGWGLVMIVVMIVVYAIPYNNIMASL